MHTPICSDQFYVILVVCGLEEINLSIKPGHGVSASGSLDVAGSLASFEEEADNVPELHEKVLLSIRDQFFDLADVLEEEDDGEDVATALSIVASIDEVLHGPSTGLHPGQQALPLDETNS